MDIRKPIGLLFLILGVILVAWGAFGGDAAAGKLPFNLNLWWGVVLLAFGGAMHLLAARAAKAEAGSCGSGCGCSKTK